eukprot:10642967-Alexandrium_andersonii.AAC.1
MLKGMFDLLVETHVDEHEGSEGSSMLDKVWRGPASSPHAAGLPKAGGGWEQAEQSMQDNFGQLD